MASGKRRRHPASSPKYWALNLSHQVFKHLISQGEKQPCQNLEALPLCAGNERLQLLQRNNWIKNTKYSFPIISCSFLIDTRFFSKDTPSWKRYSKIALATSTKITELESFFFLNNKFHVLWIKTHICLFLDKNPGVPRPHKIYATIY